MFSVRKKSWIFRWLVLWLFLPTVLAAGAGCSSMMAKATQGAVHTGAGIFAGPSIQVMVREIMDTTNVHLVREGIGGNAILITALSDLHPNDLDIQSKAAFVNCCYGLLVEYEDPQFASQLFKIAKACGMRALRTNSNFRKGLGSGKKMSELVGYLGNDYVEAMVWTATAQMLYLLQNRNDKMAQLGIPESVDLVKRAMDLDPQYLFGASQIFIASYYALVPEFMGVGSGPASSARMFEDARKVSGGKNLLVDLFEARFLSVTMRDRARFRNLLNHILQTDITVLEGGALLNDYAHESARHLLGMEAELF